MPCTTILVGKKASYDGSTIISRNDDGPFEAKKIIVVEPKDQPKVYKSVKSHVEIELPDNPLKYTAAPSVDNHNGIWPACGINSLNVGMTATETITSNGRVLGADPLVEYHKKDDKDENSKEIIGGIGEEDLVTLVLPYIKSAKEGVLRLGMLLEKYGTYESNGIAFNDENEVWWLESIGGHNWIAARVKDDEVVVMPNQFGLDCFDINDKGNYLCSSNLMKLVEDYHLDLNKDTFNPRNVFGSHDDSDHIYNTPRAWYISRYFNPRLYRWDGPNADFTPESDDIPWSLVPDKLVTIEDIKYLLGSHYQGTPYNPYTKDDSPLRGKYRSIGVPNTDICGIIQIRNNVPDEIKGVEWFSLGGGAFTAVIPLYTNVTKIPEYISGTTLDCSTNHLYWSSRILSALLDAHYATGIIFDERYIKKVQALSHQLLNESDSLYNKERSINVLEEANQKMSDMLQKETIKVINHLLLNASNHMKTRYNRGDN